MFACLRTRKEWLIEWSSEEALLKRLEKWAEEQGSCWLPFGLKQVQWVAIQG